MKPTIDGEPKIVTRFALLLVLYAASVCNAAAADRTTYAVVRPSDAPASQRSSTELPIPTESRFAESAFDTATTLAWSAYLQLWHAHAAKPGAESIRRYFSLPLDGEIEIKSVPGRSAPTFLRWKRGSYQQFDAPHFVIHSQASKEQTIRVAKDLERCYWIWTQAFFPLWEGSQQVAVTLKGFRPHESLEKYLEQNPSRLSTRQKMNVVLFRDATQYVSALADQVPGVERSTGFYSDPNRTTFLFAEDEQGNQDEIIATRRHELTHQLFREATRTPRLQRRSVRTSQSSMPGENSGFWLVEGIAGYCESMFIDGATATLGGWESSRLAYARYRILVGDDFEPLAQLETEGRIAVQQRQDIARWYAHSITYTHYLLDGDRNSNRAWVFARLAELYGIDLAIRGGEAPEPTIQTLRSFLIVSDESLTENRIDRQLARLCLAHGEVTDVGLKTIPAQTSIEWLDLPRLPITSEAIERLVPNPNSLRQLNLEATAVDRGLAPWLSRANHLNELDLSFTAIGNEVARPLSNMKSLETLWLTGTQVSDLALDTIETLPRLKSLDVQRTGVTPERLERFRKSRSDVEVNPLELR